MDVITHKSDLLESTQDYRHRFLNAKQYSTPLSFFSVLE